MEYTQIIVKKEQQTCLITLNRPEKLNALNHALIQEVGKAVADANADVQIRGILITGSGDKAFAAGADIAEFSSFNSTEAQKLSKDGNKVFDSIEQSKKPVIAAVNGFALGGGCELAMACHIRIAAEHAKFGQPEVNLGLIPGYGGTQRLVQLIGKAKALEYLMTGDMITAQEAHRLGLVNEVVPQTDLIDKCLSILHKIYSKAPLAISAIIECVNDYYKENTNGFESEVKAFGKLFETSDFKEGTSAFLEKRKATFKGS